MTPTRSICMVARTLRPACSSFLAGPQPLWPQLLAEGGPSPPLVAPTSPAGPAATCADPAPL